MNVAASCVYCLFVMRIPRCKACRSVRALTTKGREWLLDYRKAR